jgi:hypothetical protein
MKLHKPLKREYGYIRYQPWSADREEAYLADLALWEARPKHNGKPRKYPAHQDWLPFLEGLRFRETELCRRIGWTRGRLSNSKRKPMPGWLAIEIQAMIENIEPA